MGFPYLAKLERTFALLLRQVRRLAGLFNALYSPRYERITAGSSAPVQQAWAMFLTPFALTILRACERRRAMTPGLTRMRLASSASVTSRTQWFSFSTAQWPRMARAKISAGNMTEDAKNAISSRRFQSPVAAERINVARVTHMIAAISDPHSPSLRAAPGA